MKEFLSLFFSFEGRIGRAAYWLAAIIWTVLFEVAMHLYLFFGDSVATEWISLILIAALIWPILAISAKRWHDRNKSAIWILIGLIPIIGSIWILIELGCLGPVDQDNKY